LDEDTIAIGQGFRTNKEGLNQIRDAMKMIGVKVIPVELPYFLGPDACLHLMSLISFVDHDLAVVYPPLIPVPFWKELKKRKIDLIKVPENEFNEMGTNILAIEPKKCLMLEKIPKTKASLKNAGCKVLTYKGEEISHKAEGGPCCLTRPIWRE
jgi:N-dimethylarginine dimethylaminohydrolase